MAGSYYKDFFGDEVHLPNERWAHIIREHPEVEPHKGKIAEVLSNPTHMKRSRRDKNVLLYYRYYSEIFYGKYLLVVVKKETKRSFILTGYITDAVRSTIKEMIDKKI